MKKKFSFLIVVLTLFAITLSANVKADDDVIVLNVYNCDDYISDGKDDDGNVDPEVFDVIKEYEKDYNQRTGKVVKIEYNTYATNEVMLSMLKTGKKQYDLICPSDYAIQKLIRDDMLEKFDMDGDNLKYVTNYNEYASPYVKELFANKGWTEYSVGYMWGTMGFIYNPENVEKEDVSTWEIMWNEKYKNKITTKDSMRDTYVAGVLYTYRSELNEIKDSYANGLLTDKEYNDKITEIMNRCETNNIADVKENFELLKENIFGFEVDNGKYDMTTGKIDVNFAWSGDAVYAMDLAEEENDMYLEYVVPEEGSNIWFDGWCMPKGANKEVAQDFLNYLCDPEIAVHNMEKIGYTSMIAGDKVFDMILDWYGDDTGEYTVDLTYFFEGTLSDEYLTDGKALVKTAERNRQFDAQYPEYDVTVRCAIMADFGPRNDDVLQMWQSFKSNDIPVYIFVIIGVLLVGGVCAYFYLNKSKKVRNKRLKTKSK